ncbi:MAG: hypothetical protein GXY58_02925 [Planctomycetaceae bacterium]|nr:hypothetical protein [Planctomycetaceae bacterium]
MNASRPQLTRRRFLGMASAAALMAAGPASRAPAGGGQRKIVLSFYCDDTSPYVAGAKAFETFLDYCAEHEIAGESSAILGVSGHSMSRRPSEEEQAFLQQVARAHECGIDTHMELMTHGRLFDFGATDPGKDAAHEGLWLHEPEVTVEQYERYFAGIIAEGERVGVKFTGLTWPGCGCEVCTRRYAELRAGGHNAPNPAVWQALLSLARQGRFRGHTVPCFFGSSETEYGIHRKAADGEYAVYDLMPNAKDCFGIWENNPDRVDPDYYITANGESGIVVRHVQAAAPYCIWYAHWQGLNPATGVGWSAFTTVVERIRRHLQDRVVWMRPSEITERYHAAGGWEFLEKGSRD